MDYGQDDATLKVVEVALGKELARLRKISTEFFTASEGMEPRRRTQILRRLAGAEVELIRAVAFATGTEKDFRAKLERGRRMLGIPDSFKQLATLRSGGEYERDDFGRWLTDKTG